MTEETTDDLPPIEAVQALTEIEGYDEKLTARTFGLTLMVFAFAIAAIPISYAAADPWLTAHEYGSVVLSVLWLPWIAAAVAVTSAIWTTHSISLGRNSTTGNDWLLGAGFTIVFFLIATAVLAALGSSSNIFIAMGISGGLFTVLLGVVFSRIYRAKWVLLPLVVAGTGIVLGNIFLSTVDLMPIGAGFTTGFLQGAAYFITGWVISMRG
ncbi:hypothetical protein [Natrialba asiatica]|uniref:Uncharacterized protein n=1 Tax=Natrialba asiatica (strain ATCC 700177 / DSM 12278 / JCM 9576 / FERM P-10747 / NBRC 102637 / 172P1) TaxID=29540 RepID=M0B2W1_NATA1|nr:hypothetical protein [Natrialba asiatica]ELZ05256.1 hypothetical protein C481_03032 [Natrialba asiatica DSM 12278]